MVKLLQQCADECTSRRWARLHKAFTLSCVFAACPLLCSPESAVAKKAFFTSHNLWVTPYHRDQKYPSGDHVVMMKQCKGLREWTKEVRHEEEAVHRNKAGNRRRKHCDGVEGVPRQGQGGTFTVALLLLVYNSY
jgi:Copper amine oxidase, enzyme domain